MANNCDVEMTAYGKADGLIKLAGLISKHEGIMSSMVESIDKDKSKNLYLRGQFYCTDETEMVEGIVANKDDSGNSELYCDYEGAWSAQLDFHRFMEDYLKEYGVRFSYREIEPGCNVFCTNDIDRYPEKYCVDAYNGGNCMTECCMDMQDVAVFLTNEKFMEVERFIPNEYYRKMDEATKTSYLASIEREITEQADCITKYINHDHYVYIHRIHVID